MVSVLVGVAVAAGGHLFWFSPSNEDTSLARQSASDLDIDRDAQPGGGEVGAAPPSTTGEETTSTTSTASPTTSEADREVPPEPSSSSAASPSSDSPTTEVVPTEDAEPTRTSESPPSNVDDLAEQVVELVNAERAEAGCGPVRMDHRLTDSAQDHSDDMAENNYLSHTSPDGTTFDERISAAGYPRPAAENIAMGMAGAEAVMDAWMDSEGHRRNIVNCEITAIGVGVNSDGWYWTQNFGY